MQASEVALVSRHGIHQLHMFIFVLAVMQIVYSFLTVSLARAKVRIKNLRSHFLGFSFVSFVEVSIFEIRS